MFYLYDLPRDPHSQAITLGAKTVHDLPQAPVAAASSEFADDDVDFVDDALLNTAPHNKIEQQLLRGDVVGLALMSGAILWSAMGAFG